MKILHNGALVTNLALPAFGELKSNGWLLGDGIFESLKTINGQCWAQTRHLDRAYKSGAIINLGLPDRDQVERGIRTILEASERITVGRLRITFLSSGDWIITHKELAPFKNRLTLIDYPFPKNEKSILAGIKTISYGENAHALRFAEASGSDDVVISNLAGLVSESAVSNIVWESSGEFYTPPLSTGCLPGVTRSLLLQYFGVIERDTTPSQLQASEAIYLVSSTREVQQVNRYNAEEYSLSSSGVELIGKFAEWVRGKLEP